MSFFPLSPLFRSPDPGGGAPIPAPPATASTAPPPAMSICSPPTGSTPRTRGTTRPWWPPGPPFWTRGTMPPLREALCALALRGHGGPARPRSAGQRLRGGAITPRGCSRPWPRRAAPPSWPGWTSPNLPCAGGQAGEGGGSLPWPRCTTCRWRTLGRTCSPTCSPPCARRNLPG